MKLVDGLIKLCPNPNCLPSSMELRHTIRLQSKMEYWTICCEICGMYKMDPSLFAVIDKWNDFVEEESEDK